MRIYGCIKRVKGKTMEDPEIEAVNPVENPAKSQDGQIKEIFEIQKKLVDLDAEIKTLRSKGRDKKTIWLHKEGMKEGIEFTIKRLQKVIQKLAFEKLVLESKVKSLEDKLNPKPKIAAENV